MARATNSREALLTAAEKAFSQHGYADVTTAELARLAGINETTLFRQFGSKDELLRTVVSEADQRLRSEVSIALRADTAFNPTEADIAALLTKTIQLVYSNVDLLRIIVASAPFTPWLQSYQEAYLHTLTGPVEAMLTAQLGEDELDGALRFQQASWIVRHGARITLDFYMHEGLTTYKDVASAKLKRVVKPYSAMLARTFFAPPPTPGAKSVWRRRGPKAACPRTEYEPPESPGTSVRDRLITSGLDVIRTVGYRQASTKSIAQAAECAEVSIFRIFGTKSNLLREAILERTVSARDLPWGQGSRSNAGSPTLRTALERRIGEYHRLYVRQMPIYTVFSLNGSFGVETNETIFEKLRTLFADFTQFLEANVPSTGTARADVDQIVEGFFSVLLFETLDASATVTDAEDMNQRRRRFARRQARVLMFALADSVGTSAASDSADTRNN